MSKAVKELERLSEDPGTVRWIDEVERARAAHGHMMAVALREATEAALGRGREEGRVEGLELGRMEGEGRGREKERRETVLGMLARGSSVVDVAAALALDVAIVQGIQDASRGSS